MILSDISVKRPVLASVFSLILIAFGLIAFDKLPLREYPDIDPPIVSIQTVYPGAAAAVVETRITEVIEERIAGVEGIAFIESSSEDGESNITIEFVTGQDVDAAANDIRDRVAGILDNLPDEADPPEIQKVDSSDDVIIWFNLSSNVMTVPELTDYADRYLVDRFSILEGVARVRIGGAQIYAMRVWLDRQKMAAVNLTTQDIENRLRQDNIELPAGSIESDTRQFTVRIKRAFQTARDFENLVVDQGDNGYLVRLKDIARVERATEEDRTLFRGNGIPMVGIGIIKQSTANTIAVARVAKQERDRLNKILPEGTVLEESYDTSIFIEKSIQEVYKTLAIAIGLVVLVIYLFLGSFRAMLVPAVTVPVSVIATFIILLILGFSINLITLLALVLAIGLVVDDAIVVLENIARRIEERKETPIVAAYKGARQVAFAVIATTLVLIAVFVPIAFLEGDVGRLFTEFALTIAAAVAFSSFVALSLSPMIASQILKQDDKKTVIARGAEKLFNGLKTGYEYLLAGVLKIPLVIVLLFGLFLYGTYWLYQQTPSEYSPAEDRGAFFLIVNGPEGASFSYMEDYMNRIEKRLMPYVEEGTFHRLIIRSPRSFGNVESFNTGIGIILMDDWSQRKNGFEIMNEVRAKLSDLEGVRAFPIMRQGFGGGTAKPVQFVIGGGTYEELAKWRDLMLKAIDENNPGLVGLDWDYKETKPQIEVMVNYDRAAELGLRVEDIGRTLETMLGSRRVTTYLDAGEEYDVIVEGNRKKQNNPADIQNIFVRSTSSGELIPLSNVVSLREFADSSVLNRYNRVRSITIEANIEETLSLGEALLFLEKTAQDVLPEQATIDYKGESRDFKTSGQSILFVFALGILMTFLVLAGQFESYVHPFIIILTVPLAVMGGLIGLYLSAGTLNIYSQIGLIMLVGLAAKNGILIVEFINQLRDEGEEFLSAIKQAAAIRFRPILMTAITTGIGSVPLVMATGAGSETREVIGVVVVYGVFVSTILSLFVVPAFYFLLARKTTSPKATEQRLEREIDKGES